MIHPNTELRFVNDKIGYGVFATVPIPRGTLVFVPDPLDLVITLPEYAKLPPQYQVLAEKYSYMDQNGTRILSWDHAKYVNHRCDCNTISAAYGFEIAIRDIAAGEEITDEYGLFNLEYEMPLSCGCRNCRGILRPDDIDTYYRQWDEWVIEALKDALNVSQPLWDYMDDRTRDSFLDYLSGRVPYTSVLTLKRPLPVETVS